MSAAKFICFSNLQPHSVSNGIDKFVGSGRRRRLKIKKLKKMVVVVFSGIIICY